jgi:apolipoprotein D and lipocalin family protein
MRRTAALVLAVLAAALCAGCSLLSGRFGDVPTATHVDLARYMGHWRVVSHIPYFAEDGCSDSIESYALRADGDIDNWFSCRKGGAEAPLERRARSRAHVVNHDTNAEWTVTFLGVLPIKYLVVAVDPDYRWAAIGHPSRDYGWVISRDPTLPAPDYDRVMKAFRDAGYDISRFVGVPQTDAPLEPPPFR